MTDTARHENGDASRRRIALWNGVLTALLAAMILQALYAINWAGKVEQRVVTVEGAVTRLERTAGIAVQNAAKLDALEGRMAQSDDDTTARLDRIEDKLDRLIERLFSQ